MVELARWGGGEGGMKGGMRGGEGRAWGVDAGEAASGVADRPPHRKSPRARMGCRTSRSGDLTVAPAERCCTPDLVTRHATDATNPGLPPAVLVGALGARPSRRAPACCVRRCGRSQCLPVLTNRAPFKACYLADRTLPNAPTRSPRPAFSPPRSVGAGANFTGSGGAVVVYCPRGEAQAEQLRAAAQAEGYTLLRAQLGPDREALGPAPPAP